MTASVREIGILQPILVRQLGESEYELIAGERRWRAARRAGLDTIPAIIRSASEGESLQQALIENLNREELNPLEEAAGYQQLIEDFGLTHEQLSTRVGKSRVAITNALRLFQLPPSVQRLVAEARLTAGHARALLGTPDRAFQEASRGEQPMNNFPCEQWKTPFVSTISSLSQKRPRDRVLRRRGCVRRASSSSRSYWLTT